MAETKKKSSSGRKNTSKKKSSSSRSRSTNKKTNNSPDMLTIVVVVIAIVMIGLLIYNYNKEKKGGADATPTPAASVTPIPTKETEPTKTAEPTKAPTKTPEPTETAEPTPTEEVILPKDDAKRIILAQIDASSYMVELLNDNLQIEDEIYYLFDICDLQGKMYEPLVIVNRKNGNYYYYDPNTGIVSEFDKFPLDETETAGTGGQSITKEEAIAKLASISSERLGLAKEVSQYRLETDEWPTIVNAKECYGINVFEEVNGKTRLRGYYFVTYDGTKIYKRDAETEEFIEIK